MDKVQENRVRRMARRQGMTLARSTRRDPFAIDYGVYSLDGVEVGDLDTVEQHLTGKPAPAPRGSGNDWARLAREVLSRRHELVLSHSGVARNGGPSHETVRLVETQGRPSFRPLTLHQLDRGLHWKPGTALGIVAGTVGGSPAEWSASDGGVGEGPQAAVPGHPLDGSDDLTIAAELLRRLMAPGRHVEDRTVAAALAAWVAGALDERPASEAVASS